jgi:hypothetical protein
MHYASLTRYKPPPAAAGASSFILNPRNVILKGLFDAISIDNIERNTATVMNV